MTMPNVRVVKKTTIVVNSLVLFLVVVLAYSSYMSDINTESLLSKPGLGMGGYIVHHSAELLFKGALVGIVALGIALEVMRSRISVFVNLGAPTVALFFILVGCAKSWDQHPGEAKLGLILVALPLLLICTIYGILYREDIRSLWRHRPSVVSHS